MSILIRGMEMPNNCAECPVNMVVCKRCYKYLLEHTELYDRRAEDCPISYVPPHGKLIDGDIAEIITFADSDAEGKDFADGILFAADWIAKQPTIIPASEGDHAGT